MQHLFWDGGNHYYSSIPKIIDFLMIFAKNDTYFEVNGANFILHDTIISPSHK